MNIWFEIILTALVLLTGFIWLADIFIFARLRSGAPSRSGWVINAKALFPIFLIIFLIRAFALDQFRIPSGSDKPTLLVGDFIAANKYVYGLRLPITHTKFFSVDEPKIGDIVLLHLPSNETRDLIKRVIGGPGDRIEYVNKILFINGKKANQKYLGQAVDEGQFGENVPVEMFEENLNGVKHKIYIRIDVPAQDFSLTVPPNSYFVMGDNRDASNDSRYWGFVPEKNLIGKAFAIWFSWDADAHKIRWDRMGTLIQ